MQSKNNLAYGDTKSLDGAHSSTNTNINSKRIDFFNFFLFVTFHQRQQPQSLPLLTPPLCTVGWFAKTEMFVLETSWYAHKTNI